VAISQGSVYHRLMVLALALLAFLAPTVAVIVSHRLAQRAVTAVSAKVDDVQETVNGNTADLLAKISRLEELLAAANA
jgi:uncharacterized protein YoxC